MEDLAPFDARLVLGAKAAIDFANGGAAHPDADAGRQDAHAEQEEGRPAEWERHAALQRQECHQDRHRGEQKAAQHGAEEGALPASSPLCHRFFASHRLLGLLTGLDNVGNFLVTGDVVLELLQAWRELGTGAAARLEGDVVALPPFGEDALELHLTRRPIQVVADQAWVPLGDPPSVLRRGLGAKVGLGRLDVGDVEGGEELAHGGFLGERRVVDATGSRFVTLRLRVELLALSVQLLHLGSAVGGATFEVRLGFPGCPQVAAQFLDIGLAVEWEHCEAGVFLLAAAFLRDRLLECLDPLQPVPGILQAGRQQGRLERLDDAQLGLGQRRDGLPLLRELVDGGARLPCGGELSLQFRQASLEIVQRAGAPARLADPKGPFLAQAIENLLCRSVGMGRIGERDDRFLDGAGVFQAQHLAPRDARRVGVDVAADTEQLASHLQPARRIVVEAVAKLGASAGVEHANRLRVEIALDAELGPVLERDLDRQPEVAALPWAPAVGAFH